MKFYIAYGSNLNKEQMKRRCPHARAIGTSMLEGWELLFKGSKTGAHLTIERAKGKRVPVAVWAISEQDELNLDRYEGFPTYYYKRTFGILDADMNPAEAIIYIMHEDRKIGVPSEFYVETCLDGYEDFGFNPKYLYEAVKNSRINEGRV